MKMTYKRTKITTVEGKIIEKIKISIFAQWLDIN